MKPSLIATSAALLFAVALHAQTPAQQQAANDAAYLCVTGQICPPQPSGTPLPNTPLTPAQRQLFEPPPPPPSVVVIQQPAPVLLLEPTPSVVMPPPEPQPVIVAPPANDEAESALRAERQRESYAESYRFGQEVGGVLHNLIERHRINKWCGSNPDGGWRLRNGARIACSDWLAAHHPKPTAAAPLSDEVVRLAPAYCRTHSAFTLDGVAYSCSATLKAMAVK